MRWPLALVTLSSLAACGGSSSSSSSRPRGPEDRGAVVAPPATTPQIYGRVVWDGPLTDPMAKKLVERVNTALGDGPPKLAGTDPRSWQGPIATWIKRRVDLGKEIRADVQAIATDADPRMQLLAALAYGIAIDDLVADLISLEMPPEAVSGEFGAETQKVFKAVVEEHAVPLAAAGRTALQRCVTLAPASPPAMQPWAEYCKQRDGELAALEARVSARGAPSTQLRGVYKPPELFKDCDSKDVLSRSPEAPPPDMKAKPIVAYIYDGEQLTGDDARKLEDTVAAKLGKDVGMGVLTSKELAAARKLVAQKKLHAKAPVCGQPPPLPAVIAHTKKHVVIGELSTTCIYEDIKSKGECGLMLTYSRAGSDDRTGLPEAKFAPVASLDVGVDVWLAAAASLGPGKSVGGLLGSMFEGNQRMYFDAAGFADEDPWLRVGWTLEEETVKHMHACIDGAASFDAKITINKTGKTTAVALTPVTSPPAGSKVAECVKKALEATPWPCTPSGKPASVSVRMCVAPRPSK